MKYLRHEIREAEMIFSGKRCAPNRKTGEAQLDCDSLSLT